MSSNWSYLDNLNQGRQRRPRTSLEDLNRTLDDLESRIGGDRPGQGASREQDRRTRRLTGEYESGLFHDKAAHAPRESARSSDLEHSLAELRQELQRSRQHSGGSPLALSDVSGELKALREEMRTQMASGMRKEFDVLRKDIERAYGNSGPDGHELAAEMERLSNTIHSMAERSDERGLDLLRTEMEQVRQTLAELAREETVRSMDSRWERLEQRSFGREGPDPEVAALRERLEQIGEAVGNLPDSRSLLSLEEKVRTLATAIDHFSRNNDRNSPASIKNVESRLDEISRAIASSSASAQAYRTEPFERIEARISALAHQLDQLAEEASASDVSERLNNLTHRVEDIAHMAARPDESIELLHRQIATIAERLETNSSEVEREQIVDSLERRFAEIATLFEERHDRATTLGQAMFRDMEQRIDGLAERLENRREPELGIDVALLQALDEKFADLSERIDSRHREGVDPRLLEEFDRRLESMADRLDSTFRNAADLDPSLLQALDRKFADLSEQIESGRGTEPDAKSIVTLERRLQEIAEKLDNSTSHTADADPQLIANLERQIAGLAEHLSKPSRQTEQQAELAPRLDNIERSLVDQRDAIVAAAQEAAENAVRSMRDGGLDDEDIAALASELKTLEILARKSDERNSRTFEAIHDTLLKVVERLGSLEVRNGDFASSYRSRIPDADVPPMAPVSPEPQMPPPANVTPAALSASTAMPPRAPLPAKKSPAQAAAEAAVAAGASDVAIEEEEEPVRKSMLGGLARAFSGKKQARPVRQQPDPVMPGMEQVQLDAPLDGPVADKPLEPGSGAPDLNAIIKRVRDERGTPGQVADPAAGKADFIAAARRAAQAAAAEAQTFKQGGSPAGPKGKLSATDFLRAKRKPILMAAAAIMIALASLQLGKAFFGDEAQMAEIEPLPAKNALVASATDTASIDGQDDAAGTVRMVDGTAGTPAAADDGMEPAQEVDVLPAADEADVGDDGLAALPEDEIGPDEATEVAALPEIDGGGTTSETTFEAPPVEAGPIALREAAEAGDPKAMFEIGNRYDTGRGVDSDRAVAAKWYERAAEQGFAPAQYRIGSFYEKGIGVERDIARAKTWYQLAANQGNASAMHNLAVLFAMGSDGAVDNDSAARWFQKAAELGVKDSQYNLGILAAKGLGVPQSLEESYKWFALVAKTGDKDAAAKRDEVANSLRPEQLAKARATTELWKPKPVVEEANVVEIPESWQESEGTTASIDMKKAVQNIQLILNKNGYNAGSPDGIMGQNTRNAIMAFQKDNGLPADGEVSDELVKVLLSRK
ncbi:peptidoglycan-binding protein [Aquibium oceanicum]|uniref:Peptidoglycan binding-like domain-containing protein n=1 Tax=Aquibium oceanicum TaxID=1670800 RepID=A0A1L3SVT0_9HYPH|nr:peptidoglycan-binding protein [Aquibium oceanicum]APH73461.1 hypothetical protein BSQ44_20375 [Aquibium oceanicum]